jgi:hypothetical protein
MRFPATSMPQGGQLTSGRSCRSGRWWNPCIRSMIVTAHRAFDAGDSFGKRVVRIDV